MALENLTGIRFGRLVALHRSENQGRRTMWRCVCDCGIETDVWPPHLKRGATRSCGCLAQENRVNIHKTHGETGTRLYRAWAGMRNRCSNPKSDSYPWYGGKGIKVDPRFANYEDFKAWAMRSGYMDGLSIDRKDGALDYSPENCRWATKAEQSANRSNVVLDASGTPYFMIAEANGVGRRNYWSRLSHGWSHEDAATKPLTR